MDRREFLKKILRGGALLLILTLVGVVLFKNFNTDEDCETFNACQNCASKQICDKPQAIEHRNGR